MRVIAFFCLATLFIINDAQAQDIIIKKNGDEIRSKVLKIGTADIQYKSYDNQDGPVHSLGKAEVFMIKYENGTKDVFTADEEGAIKPEDNATMTKKGEADAIKYYKAYRNAKTFTGLTAAVYSPIYGLIPAVACSSTQPASNRLYAPNPSLMNNPAYRQAYTDKAFQIKRNKTWEGYGIGSGIFVGWITGLLILVSTASHR